MEDVIWLNLTAFGVADDANKPVLLDPNGIVCIRHGEWGGKKCTLVTLTTGQIVPVADTTQCIGVLLVRRLQAMQTA